MVIDSQSRKDTIALGKIIAGNLVPGSIVCLFGELGAGKTVLAKGIAAGLGIAGSRIVSPTFVLLRQYQSGRMPLYHFDLYRMNSPKGIVDIGYEEYLYGNGISVIEWPQRMEGLMPKQYLEVSLSIVSEKARKCIVSAHGDTYKSVCKTVSDAWQKKK